jgi:hypothetical protein
MPAGPQDLVKEQALLQLSMNSALVQGDTAAANTLFQKYLSGELPEELLFISRYYVQQDQKPKSR